VTLQDLFAALDGFWAARGCIVIPAYDVEVGAGTMHPATFFRALGPEPWRVATTQPVRRPADGRYGKNPNRAQRCFQYQVVLKPSPADVQEIYLSSLHSLGIDPALHDICFMSDDWESPTLGASGAGWEVWLDGMEITQFTYFQQMGGLSLQPVSVGITYAPERLAMFLQGVESIWDLEWAQGVRYADVTLGSEADWCRYHFEKASVERLRGWLCSFEEEVLAALEERLVLPAYDYVLKCSHVFNLLDGRGALSVSERASTIERIRALARGCAEAYLQSLVGP